MALVKEKYGNDSKEEDNIAYYEGLDHLDINCETKNGKIVSFYAGESFYYKILNSLLRIMRTAEEFKPCILPFSETYQAITSFYKKDLHSWDRWIPAQILYRGATLKKRDFEILQPGVFIEMLGFMSTSKSKEKAI